MAGRCKKNNILNTRSRKIITAMIQGMNLFHYLQHWLLSPTPAQTKTGECAIASVNAEVTKELEKGKENSRKRKAYTTSRTRTGHR